MLRPSLPGSFEFYHLGTIGAVVSPGEAVSPASANAAKGTWDSPDDGIVAVSLRPLTAESRYVLLARFPQGFVEALGGDVDPSVRLELANVIASRVADDLTRSRDSEGVMLTPPDLIAPAAASRLLSGMQVIETRSYLRGESAPVQVWILSTLEGSGNV